jgi:hypothetical protein
MRAWLFIARSLASIVGIVALPPLIALGASALSQPALSFSAAANCAATSRP